MKMTAIPQIVAPFNGVGGGAAALVAMSELLKVAGSRPELQIGVPSVFTIIIGGISFAGSLIAFAKLQELMTGTPITYPGQHIVNGLLALVLGVAFVLPIGGADMPVVISLLNACTDLAVGASVFALDNFALIVAGTGRWSAPPVRC